MKITGSYDEFGKFTQERMMATEDTNLPPDLRDQPMTVSVPLRSDLHFEGDTPIVPDSPTESRNDLASELEGWWREQATAEVMAVVPKAVEYGGEGRAQDLIDIGTDILRMSGKVEFSEEEAIEAGIYFYLRGKVGRWTAAMMRGQRISDDTLHDISVYCRMAQRNRAVGGWPA